MWFWIKRLMLTTLIVLAVSQVFRPAKTNPPIDPKREIQSNLSVDAQVAATLARSCNDCHSNRTVWPWYSHVAPASWLVVSDVNRARKALNFSEWSTYGSKKQREHLEEICKRCSRTPTHTGFCPGANNAQSRALRTTFYGQPSILWSRV